jgi:hypothetical protein
MRVLGSLTRAIDGEEAKRLRVHIPLRTSGLELVEEEQTIGGSRQDDEKRV